MANSSPAKTEGDAPWASKRTGSGENLIRNRFVVAAPVGGEMHRVPLRPGDLVEAGKTLLTTIEPATPPAARPKSSLS